MAISTALTQLFDIEHPIVLAPMGAVSGGRLAAAVAAAGGLGLIGPGYLGPEWIEAEFAAAGNAPVGIGFITWHAEKRPEQFEAALAHSPKAVMLSFGDPAPFVGKAKDAGAKVLVQVQNVKDAIAAAKAGADVIVAQGGEAGGHGATRGSFALTPAVADAVAPLPVVTAGGVADGRGLAAALMLGAAGVLVGTRFFASEEALGNPAVKARLVEGRGDETLRTTIFDQVRKIAWPEPWTGRALANDFTRSWHGRERELEGALEAEHARYTQAAGAADVSTAVVWASEGIDMITAVEPVGAILKRIASEAETRLKGAI